MPDWFRRALTRKRHRQTPRGKIRTVTGEPNGRLLYLVEFAVGMTVCLTALEIAYMAFMHTWNSEVFAVIAGLIGTVTGIFVGRQTK